MTQARALPDPKHGRPAARTARDIFGQKMMGAPALKEAI